MNFLTSTGRSFSSKFIFVETLDFSSRMNEKYPSRRKTQIEIEIKTVDLKKAGIVA